MYDTGENYLDNDVLLRSQDYNELNASLWNDKCDYMELCECDNLNPTITI